jgi:predicted TIM-barrel fold metal-dependent hydrolase
MAAEVRRVSAKGCHAVTFSENPTKLGYPSFHTDHWDPFWAACEETGTVVCLHIGSSSSIAVTSDDAPVDVMITVTPVNILMCAADLIWSQTFRKYPDLKIALSEGGIGWIPYFLDRIDFTYQHHKAWTHQDFGDKLPSQVFHEHIVTCFIDDPAGLKLLPDVGIDMVTWECDYPHSDSAWPNAPEAFMKTAGHLSDGDINKITHENANRIFQFDPFAVRPKAESTVAALRAQATDVDVVTRSPRQKRSNTDISSFVGTASKVMQTDR